MKKIFQKKVLNKIILIIQLYLIKAIKGASDLNYIDIGASGFKKPLIAIAFKNFKLIGFDPDPRTKINQEESFKIDFYNFAVSGKNKIQKLYLTKKPHCSSLKKPVNEADKRYQIEKVIDVECRTLDQLNISANIMKIDTQGSELDILENATNTLKNIDILETEVWFSKKYEDQPSLEEIFQIMSKNGFNFIGFSSLYYYDHKLKTKNGIEFGDMIFIKENIKPANKKYVISFLLTKCHDRFIKDLELSRNYKKFDRFVIYIVLLLGKLKDASPIII